MIKDDNKLVLLTIFLYITLNLRKVENLIQCVNNKESFTFSNESDKNKKMLAITIAKICFVILGCTIANNPGGWKYINNGGGVLGFRTPQHYVIYFIFFILLCVLIMAFLALFTIINDGWALSLDVITNEIFYVLLIYFTLNNLLLNQVNPITPDLKVSINDFIQKQNDDLSSGTGPGSATDAAAATGTALS